MVFACGGDDATTGTDVLPSQDAAVTDGGSNAVTDATTPTDAGTTDAATIPDGNSAVDAGSPTDGGACIGFDFGADHPAAAVSEGTSNVSLTSAGPPARRYIVSSVVKPAGSAGGAYKGLWSFTTGGLLQITEQWDNGAVVKRRARYTVVNNVLKIAPECGGTFPGTNEWKFYYINRPKAGQVPAADIVRVLSPGVTAGTDYQYEMKYEIP